MEMEMEKRRGEKQRDHFGRSSLIGVQPPFL